ncbi:hypothetical protein AC26_3068 [Escherichia coli 1-176-05_S3_C2]|nr:hypothetical protein AC26_3068 [Escherichia coli 1-176-05_S3_C2]
MTFAPVSDATLTRLIRPAAGGCQADKAFTPHPAIGANIPPSNNPFIFPCLFFQRSQISFYFLSLH